MPRDTANTQELFSGNDSICTNAKMSFSFSIVISQLHWKCDAETRLGHKACWDAVQWGMLHLFEVHLPEAHPSEVMGFI